MQSPEAALFNYRDLFVQRCIYLDKYYTCLVQSRHTKYTYSFILGVSCVAIWGFLKANSKLSILLSKGYFKSYHWKSYQDKRNGSFIILALNSRCGKFLQLLTNLFNNHRKNQILPKYLKFLYSFITHLFYRHNFLKLCKWLLKSRMPKKLQN